MRAVTLHQPWATLIALGAKTIETRGWPTRYRGPLAIHAAKRHCDPGIFDLLAFRTVLTNAGFVTWHDLPRGAIVAVATLSDCLPSGHEEITARTTRNPLDLTFGDLGPGRYGWLLDDVQRIRPEVLCNGKQGLWFPPPIPSASFHPITEEK